MTSENDTRDALAREMYWAEEATPRSRMDTPEVRDALHDFAMLMRDDEKAMIPRGEPNPRPAPSSADVSSSASSASSGRSPGATTDSWPISVS